MNHPPNENGTRQGAALESAKISEKIVMARREIKHEIFVHLRAWLKTGNRYTLRLAQSKASALEKEDLK